MKNKIAKIIKMVHDGDLELKEGIERVDTIIKYEYRPRQGFYRDCRVELPKPTFVKVVEPKDEEDRT